MNMKKLMVALFAGFAGVMAANAESMFYIGETGYDSWDGVYAAAKDNDTIVVGEGAQFGMSGGKSLTIDLSGNLLEWLNSGWMYGHLTFVDSIGGGQLKLADNGNRNVGGGTTDISSLTASQLTGTGKFWVNSATEIKFPQGMSLEDSKSRIANPQANMKIVVQGVTYTYDGSAWISDSPAATYSITITAPQNGTLETSVTNGVTAGTTVTVTATPATGYQLVSVTTNGAPITGTSFTMPAADVTLAATFEESSTPVDPPDEPTKMFYIGETGYDSWADAKAAAGDGDTIIVGKNAEIPNPGGTLSGAAPVDLYGRSLTFQGGWQTSGIFTFVDSVGGGKLTMPNGLNCSATLDLSGLDGSQVSLLNNAMFKVGSVNSLVKFPNGWNLETCTHFLTSPVSGAHIVVQGVTYTYDGSDWISDSPDKPTRGVVIVFE